MKKMQNNTINIEEKIAYENAESVNVLNDTIEQQLNNTDNIENIADNSVDLCPKCGGKLILRTATKGTNAGNQFWGCSNFPKCRYIKSIK